MSIESRMNKTATLLSPRPVQGGWNQERIQYEEIGKIPCRLVDLSGRKWIDGRARDDATHKLFTTSALINTEWLIEIDGRRYSIIPPVIDAGGGIRHHIEVLLKEYS